MSSRRVDEPSAGRRMAYLSVYGYAVLGAWLIVTCGGWLWTRTQPWSFSFLIYVHPFVRIAAGVLLCSVAWLALRLPGSQWSLRTPPRLASWWLVPLGGALFWLLRERSWSGDALLKLHLLATENLSTDRYVWKEPLDSFLAYSFTNFLRAWHVPPEQGIAIMSVAAGMVYLAAVLQFTRLLAQDQLWRSAMVVALLAMGSSQLWFGHIENYSWVTALGFASSALAIGYLQRRTPLWMVGLATGAAVSFHPQALFIAPALWVLLRKQEWPRQLLVIAASGALPLVITAAGLWRAGAQFPDFRQGYAGDTQTLIPGL